MNVEIINSPLNLEIYGFSGTAVNKDYTGTAFTLSGKMWAAVKGHQLKNKGINIWVYESNELVFAGVELDGEPDAESGLERKNVIFSKYAYYKHVGPYRLIKQIGLNMRQILKSKGLKTCLPYMEIYGHWNSDESKLETELLVSLE